MDAFLHSFEELFGFSVPSIKSDIRESCRSHSIGAILAPYEDNHRATTENCVALNRLCVN
jgi:hypothetical protein